MFSFSKMNKWKMFCNKHQRNKNDYFKSKHLEKRHSPQILIFYISIQTEAATGGVQRKRLVLESHFNKVARL